MTAEPRRIISTLDFFETVGVGASTAPAVTSRIGTNGFSKAGGLSVLLLGCNSSLSRKSSSRRHDLKDDSEISVLMMQYCRILSLLLFQALMWLLQNASLSMSRTQRCFAARLRISNLLFLFCTVVLHQQRQS